MSPLHRDMLDSFLCQSLPRPGEASSGVRAHQPCASRSPTSDFSSFSSATEASIFERLKSLIGTSCTISHLPPAGADREGADQVFLDAVAAVGANGDTVPVTAFVSVVRLRTVSTTAFAAEAAEEEPRALMIAAPRCCTAGMKVSFSHSSSLITLSAFLPSIFAL